MKEFWKRHNISVIVFIITFCVMQFVGTAGPYTGGDSMQYIGMGGALPPFYPLFLYAFRAVFGEGFYLQVVTVVQCLFAAFSITLLVSFFKKYFQIHWVWVALFTLALMIPYVRESMRDEPRYMMSHWILTEGMGLSLFYCYTWCGLLVIQKKKMLPFIGLSIFTFILLLVRAQFMVLLPLDFLVLCYYLWQCKKNRLKVALMGLVLIAAAYLLSGVVEDGYKIARTGTTKNAWNSSYFLLHLLYSSDPEDVALFEEPQQQELFQILFEKLDEEQYIYTYAQGSMFDKGWHWSYNFSDHYRGMKESIAEYAASIGITDEVEQSEFIARTVKAMITPLMKANGLRCIGYSLYQLPTSMTYYVFLLKENHLTLSFLMAGLIYVVTLVLLGIRVKQDWQAPVIWMLLFVLAFMIGNALVADFALHTMVRYMLYAMGIFYVVLGMLALECYRAFQNR